MSPRSPCPKLLKLDMHVAHPGTAEANILSSVTSACLQKVTIARMWLSERNGSGQGVDWEVFDDPLYRLTSQSKKLRVDFRLGEDCRTREMSEMIVESPQRRDEWNENHLCSGRGWKRERYPLFSVRSLIKVDTLPQ